MPSTYTTNLGIEKIESGAQTGVWGTTTNTNLDIIDQGVNGIHTETLAVPGDSSSPNTLPITDGAVSAGRNKFIEFADGGDLGATAYVQLTPNDAEKIVFLRNSLSGGRSVIVFQGTYNAANDFEIPNGKDVVLKFNGGGVGAVVTPVFVDLLTTGVDTTNLSIGGTLITASGAELNILDGVTATTAELNILDGVTATTAELNILDGVTATTAELNYVDGVTSNIQTQLDAKAPIASPTFTGTSTVPSLVLNTGATVTAILDEDNMASDSATALATQQSIKAYVDGSTPDFTSIGTDVEPTTDNANDLGSSTKRWKDLYLSGGAYLGGTTSANLLSDYEEGTWSVSLISPAGHSGTLTPGDGQYIKVGDMVFLTLQLAASSFTLATGNTTYIRGLPFSALTTGTGMPTDYMGINTAVSGSNRDLFGAEVFTTIISLNPTDEFGRTYVQINISVVYRTS
jgi:hypothetical protein